MLGMVLVRRVSEGDSVLELAPGTFRTERQQRAEAVAPPRPLLGDREPRVRLSTALAAVDDNELASVAAGRRAGHA